jgi:COP9 signalosome complex subunit 3
LFAKDDNIGLLRLVVERAPRWAIRKLTETYLTLSLPEIGRAAGIEDVEEVRRIVLSMVRRPGNLYTEEYRRGFE